MAATITFVGTGNTITWGANSVVQPNAILTTVSASVSNEGETIDLRSEIGVPDGFVLIPGMSKAAVSGYASTAALPAIGATFNLNATIYYVESVKEAWEAKGVAKVDITGSAIPS